MKAQVETLLNDALEERPDLFLIGWEINNENHIKITIDGDQGVRVQDCIEISRGVEHNLDRDAWDFSIEVLSAGVTEPLTLKRQYKKYRSFSQGQTRRSRGGRRIDLHHRSWVYPQVPSARKKTHWKGLCQNSKRAGDYL